MFDPKEKEAHAALLFLLLGSALGLCRRQKFVNIHSGIKNPVDLYALFILTNGVKQQISLYGQDTIFRFQRAQGPVDFESQWKLGKLTYALIQIIQ